MARRDNRSRLMTMELTGPFFERDPAKTYRQNIRDLQDEIAKVGADEVRARLRSGAEATSAGPAIRGRTSSLGGKRWTTTAVISAAHAEFDGPTQRRIMAQLSGRRNAIITRSFTKRGKARIGKSVGTTVGADGRKAFAGAVRALRRVVKDANMTKGM